MHLCVVNVEKVEPFMWHVGLAHRQTERMRQRIPLLVIHLIHLHVVKWRLDHRLRKVSRHHHVVGQAVRPCIYTPDQQIAKSMVSLTLNRVIRRIFIVHFTRNNAFK